jgi:hypothetical protein
MIRAVAYVSPGVFDVTYDCGHTERSARPCGAPSVGADEAHWGCVGPGVRVGQAASSGELIGSQRLTYPKGPRR